MYLSRLDNVRLGEGRKKTRVCHSDSVEDWTCEEDLDHVAYTGPHTRRVPGHLFITAVDSTNSSCSST